MMTEERMTRLAQHDAIVAVEQVADGFEAYLADGYTTSVGNTMIYAPDLEQLEKRVEAGFDTTEERISAPLYWAVRDHSNRLRQRYLWVGDDAALPALRVADFYAGKLAPRVHPKFL